MDIPDGLMQRAKKVAAERRTTLRVLMVDALDQSLNDKPKAFTLRDASAGTGSQAVDNETINQAIDSQREGSFTP